MKLSCRDNYTEQELKVIDGLSNVWNGVGFIEASRVLERLHLEQIVNAFQIPSYLLGETPKQFMHRWRDDGVQLACLIERLEKYEKNNGG